MTRKNKQIIFSSLGVILYSLSVGFCITTFSGIVPYFLIASIPVMAALFFIGVFRSKDRLYKIGIILTYFGIIALVVVKGVIVSGILDKIDSPEAIKDIVLSFGAMGKLVFVAIQFLQVTFIPIPSTVVTAAGAAIYSPWEALLLSTIGLMIGSFVAFFLGRVFGVRLVKWIIGEEALNKYYAFVKGKDKAMLIYMFIFPAFPDDMLCMIAGLTNMTYTSFFIIQLVARPLNVALTVFLVDRIKAVPFSGTGIIIWVAIGLILLVTLILMWKYADKLEKAMLNFIGKITGKNREKKIRKIVQERYRRLIPKKEEEKTEEVLQSVQDMTEIRHVVDNVPVPTVEPEDIFSSTAAQSLLKGEVEKVLSGKNYNPLSF